MRRLPTLRPRAGMEVLPTDRLASRSRLDTSPLQFALDDIESHLKREHGERRPTDDRGSRQDQKRRHLNLSNVAKRKWERQKGRSCDQERYAVCVNSGEPDAALDCPCMTMHTIRAASATEIVLSAIAKNAKAPLLIQLASLLYDALWGRTQFYVSFVTRVTNLRKVAKTKIAVPNHDKLGPLPLPNRESIEPLDSVELALAVFARTPTCITTDTRTPTSGSLFSLHSRNPKIGEADQGVPLPLQS